MWLPATQVAVEVAAAADKVDVAVVGGVEVG